MSGGDCPLLAGVRPLHPAKIEKGSRRPFRWLCLAFFPGKVLSSRVSGEKSPGGKSQPRLRGGCCELLWTAGRGGKFRSDSPAEERAGDPGCCQEAVSGAVFSTIRSGVLTCSSTAALPLDRSEFWIAFPCGAGGGVERYSGVACGPVPSGRAEELRSCPGRSPLLPCPDEQIYIR